MHTHTLKQHPLPFLPPRYLSAKDPTYVDYMRFSDEVESIFTHKNLEKTPTAEVQQFVPPVEVDLNILSPEEEQILQKTMHRLAERVRVGRRERGEGKVEEGRGGGVRVLKKGEREEGGRGRQRSREGWEEVSVEGGFGEGGVEVDVSTHTQDYTWVTFSLCKQLSIMSSVGKDSKERCLGGVVGV